MFREVSYFFVDGLEPFFEVGAADSLFVGSWDFF